MLKQLFIFSGALLLYISCNNSITKETKKSNKPNSDNQQTVIPKDPSPTPDLRNIAKVDDLPYYFMAIHMEPEENNAILDSSFSALEQLVENADKYNMKLTIMKREKSSLKSYYHNVKLTSNR